MSETNPNAKSLAAIDLAFDELSIEAGSDGESYRTAHGGRHRFEIGRSKTHPDPLDAWGPRIAEAAGCRVRVTGWSEDRTLVQGFLDADNWAIDSAGIAAPYADGSFDDLPGEEHWPRARGAAPKKEKPSEASPPQQARRPLAHLSSASFADLATAHPRQAPPHAPPSADGRQNDAASRALALAASLRSCGVDLSALREAIERLEGKGA